MGQGKQGGNSTTPRPLRSHGGGRGISLGGNSRGRGPFAHDFSENASRFSRREVEARSGHVGDIFQSKGLTPNQVGRYLKINTPRLRRYQSAFGRFYDLAFAKGLDLNANLTQISAVLLDLDSISPSQARNAYAALLCIPGMESIKYQPLLQKVKRKWNARTLRRREQRVSHRILVNFGPF